MKKKATPVDPQLDGGPDLDTTNLSVPSSLRQKDKDLIRPKKGEYGSGDLSTDQDFTDSPTADDPFVPGTNESSDNFNADKLLSSKEKHTRKDAQKDPKGENGPTYETNQGDAKQEHGGSVDPNNSLTESDSGLRRE